METEIYSIPLALEDFLPVIFSGIGLFILARMISRMDSTLSKMAYLGVALITLGGLSKAIWKLTVALTDAEVNIQILDNALFFGLSLGFILFAYALWYAQRHYFEQNRPNNVWFFPILVCTATLGAAIYTSSTASSEPDSTEVWFFILLGMTTIFNFTALGLAIRQARRQKQYKAMMLFAVNLIAIIVLQGLARAGDQSEAGQWVAQITNTIAQLGLVYGSWLLFKYVRDNPRQADSSDLRPA